MLRTALTYVANAARSLACRAAAAATSGGDVTAATERANAAHFALHGAVVELLFGLVDLMRSASDAATAANGDGNGNAAPNNNTDEDAFDEGVAGATAASVAAAATREQHAALTAVPVLDGPLCGMYKWALRRFPAVVRDRAEEIHAHLQRTTHAINAPLMEAFMAALR